MSATEESTALAVLGPADALAAGEPTVGGKATGLAKLVAAGESVPWWVVLPVDAFERHVAAGGIRRLIDDELARLTHLRVAAVGEILGRAVLRAPMDPGLAAAVQNVIRERGRLAVRSSVVGEDSATHSFAGLFDSYLSLKTPEQVLWAIKRCWASAFNERALAYRLDRDGQVASTAVAVILQGMVEGEVSGVLFTSNPISQRDDEALISACWGLGDGIVSGVCRTDELVLSHSGREVSANIADKDVRVVSVASGGTGESSVDDGLRAARSLDRRTARELLGRGLDVARALGGPQDIEWTVRDGELFLLQARPITAKPAPLGRQRIVWDNSNIQESFNGVTSPLSFSLAVRAYERTWVGMQRLLGASDQTLEHYEPVFRNMIGHVDGHVYYNINNWYRAMLLLPGFNRRKEGFEKAIGIEHPVDFIEDQELSRAEKLRRLPALVRAGARIAREFRRREKSIERFLADFNARTGAIDRDALARADLDELIPAADEILAMFDQWSVPTLNDMFLGSNSQKLHKLLVRDFGNEADGLVVGLLSGADAIESKEPTRRLVELARMIQANPELSALLHAGAPVHALAQLRGHSAAVAAALDEYVERYGDRCMGEQKVETISVRQDPAFLVKILRNFAARPELDPDALDRVERERRTEYEQRVFGALGRRRARRVRRVLANARSGVKARENLRFARTRLVGWARVAYVAVGERLHEAGLLDEPRDVFYLTDAEIRAYHEGRSATRDLAALARLRRQEFAGYEKVELPNQFETFGSPYDGQRRSPGTITAPSGGRALQGTGCCPGVVEAELCVILSPDDDLAVNGRILTTVRTDPGWGPLFPSAAGLLIERGSTLSHSAILAREFGIPCVVGVPGLIKTVRHGERVRLDGAAGTVERLEQS